MASLCALCVLGAGLGAAVVTTSAGARSSASSRARARAVVAQIEHYRRVTWHWQRVLGEPKTHASATVGRMPGPAYRRWVLRLWRRRAARVEARAARWFVRRARAAQETVVHWQRVMGTAATPPRQTASASSTLSARRAAYRRWHARARAILRRAQNPPHELEWQCIHRYEGAWNDSGAPYWGGLQMSLTFQQRYGAYLLRTKGTADHWTPLEQMWVADRALRSGRGFYPWPNTARLCGLL